MFKSIVEFKKSLKVDCGSYEVEGEVQVTKTNDNYVMKLSYGGPHKLKDEFNTSDKNEALAKVEEFIQLCTDTMRMATSNPKEQEKSIVDEMTELGFTYMATKG